MGAVRRWLLVVVVCLAGAALAADGDQPPGKDMIRLPIKFPRPGYGCCICDPPADADQVEMPDAKAPLPWVPKNIAQVALNKAVTGSGRVVNGSLKLVTDGQKEAYEDSAVEIQPKLQWVQIDLGKASEIWDIAVWHFHMEPIVVHDVVVQVSDDPKFVDRVTTLFNNDKDNSAQLGAGTDREYWETHLGRIIDGKRTKARYLRLYSHGSTYTDALNRWTEVEVWGL